MSKAISRRDFLKVTGAVGAAGLLAACGGNGGAASSTASSAAEAVSVAGLSSDPVTLTMSWWGGESRHNAYQEALKAFSAEHTTITVNPTFAAWSGWEDTMKEKRRDSKGRILHTGENDLSGHHIRRSIAGIGININQEVFNSDAPNPVSLKQTTKYLP